MKAIIIVLGLCLAINFVSSAPTAEESSATTPTVDTSSTTTTTTTTASPTDSSSTTPMTPDQSSMKPEAGEAVANRSDSIETSFTCQNRKVGYYADIDTKCKVYHFCILGKYNEQEVYQRVSYMCLNDTVFDQQALDCVEISKLTAPCEDSEKFYEQSNAILRKAVIGSTNPDDTKAKDEKKPEPETRVRRQLVSQAEPMAVGANATQTETIVTSFTCLNREVGYYADVETKCKAYHFCLLGKYNGQDVYQRVSYMCLNDTVFDQQTLDCVDSSKVVAPCEESPKFYDKSNAALRNAVSDKPTEEQKSETKKIVGKTDEKKSDEVEKTETKSEEKKPDEKS